MSAMGDDRAGTMLLVPGLAQRAEQVRPLADAVVRELPLQAVTPEPLDTLAEMVAAVRGALVRPGPTIVGGVSMGAAVSLLASVGVDREPDGLVQIAPAATPDGLPPDAHGYISWLIEAVERGGFDGLRRRLPDTDRAGLDQVDDWAVHLRAQDALHRWRDALVSVRLPGWSTLEALPCPVLVIGWPDDPIHPLAIAQEYARRAPRAELVVVDPPTTRHLPVERLAPAITRFCHSVLSASVEQPHGGVAGH